MQIKTFKKLVAMTLAEVLITLIVLGTVTALVIPTLKVDADKIKMEALFKKTFYDLDAAYSHAIADSTGHSVESLDISTDAKMKTLFSKYLNVQKDCSDSDKCFANTNDYKNYTDGQNNSTFIISHNKTFLLTSGVSVFFRRYANKYPIVYVDLNAEKGPNVAGYDLFVFKLDTKEGLLPCNGTFCAGKYTEPNWSASKDIIDNNWKIPDYMWN